MPARALMFQGTGSDVGKSLIVAGLARAFTQRGLNVRPFKPQNMSNNAAVTADGGEIGRAQALQARAARVAPSVHMNPVLLKPQSEIGAQIVVQGRVFGSAKAAAYQHMKRDLLPFVLDSFARLRGEADIVLVEGAGSAAEVNLRENDIANMGFARAADVPVVLIGDIDRGGVIASLVGTKAVIAPEDAALICGFIVNKFRGDPALFAAGMERIAQLTGWEALGLVPFFPDARLLPAEDALALEQSRPERRKRVCASPCRSCRTSPISTISIRSMPSLRLNFVRVRPGARCLATPISSCCPARRRRSPILRRCARPASTSTSPRIGAAAASFSACAAAIRCSGERSPIPTASKARPAKVDGLGLLDVATTLSAEKRLEPARGTTSDGAPFAGYEMHMGVTEGPDRARPFARLADGSAEGAVSADGARGRHLRPWPVRRRPAARGVACAPCRGSGTHRLRAIWSSKRSTRLRRTSPRISISIGCSN